MFTSTGPSDGIITLALSGEVDIAVAEEFVAAATACLDDAGATTLAVDLAAVTFLDSSGLGALVRIRNDARTRGKALVVANTSPTVMKVFVISGLSGVLTFEPGPPGDVADG